MLLALSKQSGLAFLDWTGTVGFLVSNLGSRGAAGRILALRSSFPRRLCQALAPWSLGLGSDSEASPALSRCRTPGPAAGLLSA